MSRVLRTPVKQPLPEPTDLCECGHMYKEHGELTSYCFHRDDSSEWYCQCVGFIPKRPEGTSPEGGAQQFPESP